MDTKTQQTIANVLETMMTQAGYFDDFDEIIMDIIDNQGVAEAIRFADQLQTSLEFINQVLNKDIGCDFMGIVDDIIANR